MPSAHSAAPGAIRQLPRQSGVSPHSLCRPYAGAPLAASVHPRPPLVGHLLHELNVGCIPRRVGIRSSRARSVGPSVTPVRIAHPATETFVVALVRLAVSRIERFGLPAGPAATRAPVSHRPSRIPGESSEFHVPHVSVAPPRAARSARTRSASSATRSDQTSPALPRQWRTVPGNPRPAASPWRTSPPTFPAASQTRPGTVACPPGAPEASTVQTAAAAIPLPLQKRFQTACRGFTVPIFLNRQTALLTQLVSELARMHHPPREMDCSSRAYLVLGDRAASIPPRCALVADFIAQGVHQPRRSCGLHMLEQS